MTKHILIISVLLATLTIAPAKVNASERMEIIEVEQSQINIVVKDFGAMVYGAAGKSLYVYDITGKCIQTIRIDSHEKRIDLKKGCYILKIDNVARKISIK